MEILKFPLDKVSQNGKNSAEIYNTRILDFCQALHRSQTLGKLCFLLKKVIDHKQEQIDKTINLTQDELQALLQEYAQEILHAYERQNRRGDPRRT